MKMFAFHCGGEKTLRSVFDPFDPDCGSTIHVPYFFYLIRHPDGDVLFDSGAHPGLLDDPRARLGDAADLYEIVMSRGDDVRSRLDSLGVDAEGIGHVVQSHLHYDHAGGLEFVQDATVYVQQEELRFAHEGAGVRLGGLLEVAGQSRAFFGEAEGQQWQVGGEGAKQAGAGIEPGRGVRPLGGTSNRLGRASAGSRPPRANSTTPMT